jgi:hypothetical protein
MLTKSGLLEGGQLQVLFDPNFYNHWPVGNPIRLFSNAIAIRASLPNSSELRVHNIARDASTI